MQTRNVQIDVAGDGNITASPDSIPGVYKYKSGNRRGDKIKWECDRAFTIEFEDPRDFRTGSLRSTNNKVRTGAISQRAEEALHKYTIKTTDDSGNPIEKDPDYRVRP